MTLNEKIALIDQKRSELQHIFDSHRDSDGNLSFAPDVEAEVKGRNVELDKLDTEVKQARQMAAIAEANSKALAESKAVVRPVPFAGKSEAAVDVEQKAETLGELFIKSESYQQRSEHKEALLNIETKTLFQTTAGYAPQVLRVPGMIVPMALQEPLVANILPRYDTEQAAFSYMIESLNTNSAAETAEGGTYPESAFDYDNVTGDIRKIATSLPITDEQLEDVPFIRDYLMGRLQDQLLRKLDAQLLAGNGTSPNIRGFLNVVGIQTQAKATDPACDAIFKAITKVKSVGFSSPSMVIMHPNDFQDIRLAQSSTNMYLWANPYEIGPQTLFGLPILQTTYITEGTALVGDFARYCYLVMRRGITSAVTNSHADDFTKGLSHVRVDMRCGLAVTRPTAFCTVTGL